MVSDQIPNRFLDRRITDLHLDQLLTYRIGVRALIRLLARIELRVHIQSMLEVVDTQCHCLSETDGAQMSCDFHTALVCSLNCRTQHRPGNEVVSLEIIHAAIDPE